LIGPLKQDELHDSYDFIYDQIVSILATRPTRIVHLNNKEVQKPGLDARVISIPDNTYREGIVQWIKRRQASA